MKRRSARIARFGRALCFERQVSKRRSLDLEGVPPGQLGRVAWQAGLGQRDEGARWQEVSHLCRRCISTGISSRGIARRNIPNDGVWKSSVPI